MLDSGPAVGPAAHPIRDGISSAPSQREAVDAASAVIRGGTAKSGGGGSVSSMPHSSRAPTQAGTFLARVLKAAQSFQPDPDSDAPLREQGALDVPQAAHGPEWSLGSNPGK